MLTIYSFKTYETLAKVFFASIPVWWRRTRKTNSVLCICGGCGSHYLSYGETQEIPSQIEIEKSAEGHTAKFVPVPNQWWGTILSGQSPSTGVWRFGHNNDHEIYLDVF